MPKSKRNRPGELPSFQLLLLPVPSFEFELSRVVACAMFHGGDAPCYATWPRAGASSCEFVAVSCTFLARGLADCCCLYNFLLSNNNTSTSYFAQQPCCTVNYAMLMRTDSLLSGCGDLIKDQEEARFRAQGQSSHRDQRCHRQIQQRLCVHLR